MVVEAMIAAAPPAAGPPSTRAPHAALISNGLATIGFALPAAIAAALAEPARPLVAFVGDSGLAMSLGELSTAAERRCRVVIVVFNDAALSLIDLKQAGRSLARRGCRSAPVDFAAAARALGLEAEHVEATAELPSALAQAFAGEGPYLLDVQVDPRGYPALLEALRG